MAYAAKVTKASQLGAIIELAKNSGLTINSVLENKVTNFPTEGIIVSIGTSSKYGVNWCKVENSRKIAKKTAIRDFSVADVVAEVGYSKEDDSVDVTVNNITISGEVADPSVIVTLPIGEVSIYELQEAVNEFMDQAGL